MTTKNKFIVLGCGNSAGVPAIGNRWGKCDPQNPRNRRQRASAAIRTPETSVVVDTGPDFRAQCNQHNIRDVDAILYTHVHADHIHGIDDLRVLIQNSAPGRQVPVYALPEAIAELEERFAYLFRGAGHHLYPPVVKACAVLDEDLGRPVPALSEKIEILPFLQDHGTVRSLGYRVADIAYSTDMIRLPEASYNVLRGIKTWIIDAAGYHSETNPVHASLNKIIEMNTRIGAERLILTHLSPQMDYETLMNETPDTFEPAYDGMTLTF